MCIFADGRQKQQSNSSLLAKGSHLRRWAAEAVIKLVSRGMHPSGKRQAGKATNGRYIVQQKDDLILVYDTRGGVVNADGKEKVPIAFFRAPSPVVSVCCAGDKVAVGCQSGAVLTLNAAWLTDGGAAAWCEPAAAAAAAAALVRETPCAGGSSSVSKAEQQDEAEWVTDAEWGVSRYMEEEEEDILDLISEGEASDSDDDEEEE